MEDLIKDIIVRLEGLTRCEASADYHLDVGFDESETGDWISFYDIEEVIKEIKEGNIKHPKPVIEDKHSISTTLSMDEEYDLAIENLRKLTDKAYQQLDNLNNNNELI